LNSARDITIFSYVIDAQQLYI